MNQSDIQEDIAIVKEINNGFVLVEVIPSGSCDNCAMHGVCGEGKKQPQHKIKTDIVLNIGDKVLLEISPSSRVISSLLLFLMPIILMIVFYFTAKLSGLSEDLSIILSISSLLVSALIIKLLDKILANKLAVTILRKVEN